jgi:hypothetical protein
VSRSSAAIAAVRSPKAAQEGAPQARQIADRFHIVQNLREAIQVQLSRASGFCARPLLPTDGDEVASVRDKHGGAEHRRLSRIANQHSRQAVFDHVRRLWNEGRNVREIVQQTGFDRRTIAKWIRANTLPERSASAPKTTSPRHFEDYLSRRWSEGCVRGRRLFQEIKARGCTGSFSNLERLLAKWPNPKCKTVKTISAVPNPRPVDPATGRFDLADCGCGALHQAAWIIDRQSSCESRCAEKGLARVRHHASTRHAI